MQVARLEIGTALIICTFLIVAVVRVLDSGVRKW